MLTRIAICRPHSRLRHSIHRTRLALLTASLVITIHSIRASEDSTGEATAGQEQTTSLQSEVTLPLDAATTYGIHTEPVRKRLLTDVVIAFGRIAYNANAVAHVSAPVEGRVTELPVGLGDSVKKGDELLILDSPQLGEAQSDLLQKQSSIATAKTTVELARATYDRVKLLVERSGTSQAEFQRAAGELRTAENGLRSAETAAIAAENKLRLLGMDRKSIGELITSGTITSSFRISAPISGQVSERAVTLGEVAGPNKETLFVLTDTRTMWALADVADIRLRDLKIGARARIKVPAASDTPFEGSVSFISSETNPNTRTGEVRIEVPNQTGLLRAGMFAQCEIEAANKPGTSSTEVLAVPEQAIQSMDGQTIVFVGVEDEPDSFAKRRVKIGKPLAGMVPVISGLKENEPVVTTGTFLLKAELGRANVREE